MRLYTYMRDRMEIDLKIIFETKTTKLSINYSISVWGYSLIIRRSAANCNGAYLHWKFDIRLGNTLCVLLCALL